MEGKKKGCWATTTKSIGMLPLQKTLIVQYILMNASCQKKEMQDSQDWMRGVGVEYNDYDDGFVEVM